MTSLLRLILLVTAIVASICNISEKWIHEMSSVNPLSDQWQSMTVSESLDYYTAYDLCAMTNPNSFRSSCEYIPGILTDYCNSKPCSLTAEPLLKRHISTHPWPRTKGLVDLISSMKAKGSNTLFLVGDSVTRQLFENTLCDLKRVGLGTKWYELKATDHFKAAFGMEVFPTTMSEQEVLNQTIPFFRIIYLQDTYYYHPQFSSDHFPKDLGSLEYINSILNTPQVTKTGQTFIFNFGLHFTPYFGYDTEKFNQVTDKFVTVMDTLIQNGHTVMFRESSAQHFPTEDGRFIEKYHRGFIPEQKPISKVQLIAERAGLVSEKLEEKYNVIYDTKGQNPVSDYYYCTAIRNESMITHQNWQTPIILDKLHTHLESGRIGFIYFFNVTAGRHDLHVGELGDCTHYCASPMIWYPIWEQAAQYYHHKHGGNNKLDKTNPNRHLRR